MTGEEVSLSRDDGDDGFWELLRLQGHNRMITKKDLLEKLRNDGWHVGERQLTTYISEGLVPKSARLGRRTGVFPELVVDLVASICYARSAHVSFAAIRQLAPVWRFLKASILRDPPEIDLARLEEVIRENVMSREAAVAVPWVVPMALVSPSRTPGADLLVLYNGRKLSDAELPVISFVVVDVDEHDESRAFPAAELEVVLPLPLASRLGRTRMVVGAPIGVEVVDRPV